MIRGRDEGGFMPRGLDTYRSVVVGVGSGLWGRRGVLVQSEKRLIRGDPITCGMPATPHSTPPHHEAKASFQGCKIIRISSCLITTYCTVSFCRDLSKSMLEGYASGIPGAEPSFCVSFSLSGDEIESA